MAMNNPGQGMSLLEYRRLALMSLWVGLIATVGIVMALIPNVELVILTAFLGGVALGPKRGFIVAVLGEAIFSALNPIGSGLGFPILYAFQLLSVGLSGWVGGLFSNSIVALENVFLKTVLMGLLGFVLTLIYDLLTALSFPLSSGIIEGTLWGTVVAGLAFFVMHMVSNTTLFAIFGPALVQLVRRQLLMHGLENV